MRRYGVLFVVALAIGLALAAFARRPASRSSTPALLPPAPVVRITLEIGSDDVTPEIVTVPLGSRVMLSILNRTPRDHGVSLAGYQDRVAAPRIVAGQRWSDLFIADRPGDGFAWLVDGRPMGHLDVQGPHLIEGHR